MVRISAGEFVMAEELGWLSLKDVFIHGGFGVRLGALAVRCSLRLLFLLFLTAPFPLSLPGSVCSLTQLLLGPSR